MSMMSDSTVSTKTAMETVRISDIFVERVPDKNWRQRAAEGLPPSSFFSVRGVARINDAFACIEFNLGATTPEGKFLKFPTAKADRNGVKAVVSPTRANDHAAALRSAVVNGIETPVLDENGLPVLAEAVSLPAGWTVMHTVKARINLDRGSDISLTNVEVSPVLKEGGPVYRTLSGVKRPCYKIVLHDSTLATVPRERIELATDEDDEVIGASHDWRDAAARRNAVATPANVSAADAAIEAAAAAGAALR